MQACPLSTLRHSWKGARTAEQVGSTGKACALNTDVPGSNLEMLGQYLEFGHDHFHFLPIYLPFDATYSDSLTASLNKRNTQGGYVIICRQK
jgi:hypothetical protein